MWVTGKERRLWTLLVGRSAPWLWSSLLFFYLSKGDFRNTHQNQDSVDVLCSPNRSRLWFSNLIKFTQLFIQIQSSACMSNPRAQIIFKHSCSFMKWMNEWLQFLLSLVFGFGMNCLQWQCSSLPSEHICDQVGHNPTPPEWESLQQCWRLFVNNEEPALECMSLSNIVFQKFTDLTCWRASVCRCCWWALPHCLLQ